MMYPFVDEEILEKSEEQEPYTPREYGIDFETGQLTGKIVEGIEAVKVWAWLALKTPLARYYIYSWGYGHEFESMIGKGYSPDYTKMELERMAEECLTVHPCITGIENFECLKEGSKVTLSFSIVTDFGNEEVSVDV